tara:strand:+ start:258 stop:389 length:132 start_codon:yes stop_codon:yes gene_type:complete
MILKREIENILSQWGEMEANLSSHACRERIAEEIIKVINKEKK